MKLTDHFFSKIKTSILLPKKAELLDFRDGRIRFNDPDLNRIQDSEPYICHGTDKVGVDQYRKFYPRDAILVMLFGPNKELFLQIRGKNMRWEPLKIDLVSVAAQRRAYLEGDRFIPADLDELAIKKIAEETGLPQSRVPSGPLTKLGKYHNPNTNDYQTIYGYQVNATIEELNEGLIKIIGDKPEKWFSQGYEDTIQDYFGEGIEKYAGGVGLRAVNFISQADIRRGLNQYYKSLLELA